MRTQEFANTHWWTVSQAALAWHVCYTTAMRAIKRGAGFKAFVQRPDGSCAEAWYCLRGQPRLVGRRGNPCFRLSDYQRSLISRRWAAAHRPSPTSTEACPIVAHVAPKWGEYPPPSPGLVLDTRPRTVTLAAHKCSQFHF